MNLLRRFFGPFLPVVWFKASLKFYFSPFQKVDFSCIKQSRQLHDTGPLVAAAAPAFTTTAMTAYGEKALPLLGCC
jgi:hypothetical protein